MYYYVIYMSSTKQLMEEAELFEILEVSRANNAKVDVTGMLLYYDGNFIQVLEGQQENVQEVYNRIKDDPRHHSLRLLGEGNMQERIFSEWSMGFKSIKRDDEIPGFKNFLTEVESEDSIPPTRAHMFLSTFKESIR